MRPIHTVRAVLPLLVLATGLLLAGSTPASAVRSCGGVDPYDVFFEFGTTAEAVRINCSQSFLRCYEPKQLSGPEIRVKDPACDPAVEPCTIQAWVELEFPGTEDNRDDVFNYSPWIYWYDQASPPPDCDPGSDPDCGQIATCGVSGASSSITTDTVETWVEIPDVSCQDLSGPLLRAYSLTGFSCVTSCTKTLDVAVPARPQDVKAALGCPDPPMESCNRDAECRQCLPGGVGAGGSGPAVGGSELGGGTGAFLYYTAGGAGATGLPGSAEHSVALGRHWSHDYARRIVPSPDESHVWLITEHATFREFSSPDASGVYQTVAPSNEHRTLTFLGSGLGWELRGLDGAVDSFDDSGRWTGRVDRNGNTTEAFYDASGALETVEFPDQRHEAFAYHADGKLASITEVGVDGVTSRTFSYTWSGEDLTRVDRPDGTALLLTYGDPDHPGVLTLLELEGADGTSTRVLRGWVVDAEGNVTKTWRGDASPDGPDAVDVWALAFDDPVTPTVTTVTPPVGDEITYQLDRDTVSSNVKVTSIAGDCPTCGLGPNSQLHYEDPAHPLLPTRIVDGRGTETLLEYDEHGQSTSRTEAFGEPEERTTTWTYDPNFPALVTSMEQPSTSGDMAMRGTDWTRDAQGNATDRTISGVEAGSAFSLTTTTTFNAEGQPLTIDPPGHGTDDVTEFSYDPGRGNLVAESRTDPLIGSTLFDYDAFNRRTSVTDPNLVETTTAFDDLDRVTEVRQLGESPPADDLVTTHEYNAFGDLLRTTLPEGNVIGYGYDPAGRLVSIERKPDAFTPGERTLFTLNAAGNRTLEELQRWDPAAGDGAGAWVTVSSTAFEYTNRCQAERIVQAPGSPEEAVTSFEYDCEGNLSAQYDPNHDPDVDPPTTSYTYDSLNRLLTVSQPWAGGGQATTSYAYDVQDHLVAVTDAEGNTTTYTYSDRDLLTQEVSPVSGTTTHSYSDSGELVSTTDARGVAVTRTVDALDRVTFVDYPDDALDTTYTYDTAPAVCGDTSFPVGRLGSITRDGQAVDYCYDRFGRTLRDGGLTYTWDGNGNRTSIGYPGGVTASYTHDFADREVSLEVTSSGGTETVVSAATYLPSGPLSSLALGSGTTETRAFDGRYAPVRIGVSGDPAGVGDRTFDYTTDAVGNVLEIVERDVCPDGPLILEGQTVTTTETVTHCADIEAGAGYAVESPGDVTFEAEGAVVLKDGFSVGDGARFVAGSAGAPELSRRTFTYQSPQDFLTGASGPWGELSWSYDRIGNRLSEIRDGATDAYQYLTNGAGGNTPVLDLVSLAVGGTRDYTYGLAGHLEDVAAGANLIDFGADAEGRLSGATRTAADVSASVLYDGRSFLTRAVEMTGDPPAEAASVEAVYDSQGLLHALRRQASPTDPQELVVFVYLAGRPVAQLAIDGAGAETWSYLTTDHLGTPLLATDADGAVTWEGGFLPFGGDYQAGTPNGALENGIYLRLPGQWDDSTWSDATSGSGVTYNVMRWLEVGAGRYTRPDPLGAQGDIHPYLYSQANPLGLIDPLGEKSRICCTPIQVLTAFKHCFIETVDEETGESETRAVHRVRGKGCKYEDDTFDTERVGDPKTDCGPWNKECGTDECVAQEFGNYPNPSDYQLIRGPNSNSFGRTVADACGLTAPPVAGTTRTPGWDKDGRPAKNQSFKCPEVRR